MLLNGTEFQDPAYRRKHGIESKFRIVPLDFGEYEGERVLDYEEVGIGTNDMSFDDYLYLRGIALLVEALKSPGDGAAGTAAISLRADPSAVGKAYRNNPLHRAGNKDLVGIEKSLGGNVGFANWDAGGFSFFEKHSPGDSI